MIIFEVLWNTHDTIDILHLNKTIYLIRHTTLHIKKLFGHFGKMTSAKMFYRFSFLR